jgi:cysteine-rich repeat protein
MSKNIFQKINIFFVIFLILSPLNLKIVVAAPQDVVISEIMVGQSGATTNEFIELYNRTDSDINLSGYSLKKKTASVKSKEIDLVSSAKFLGTIPARGFFLISPPAYQAAISADLTYSTTSTIADNNTIILYDASSVIIDKVGYGTAGDFETQAAINPNNNKSIVRKISAGVMIDSDNNSTDFLIQDTPTPKNSTSPKLLPTGGGAPPANVCGNNILENGEACDDGNLISGDGCDASCKIELPASSDQASSTPPIASSTSPLLQSAASSTPQVGLGEVLINEFVSDPSDGENEWIEIYNNTSKEIDLSNWHIEDGSGAKTNLSGKLGGESANKFLVIENPKGNLNNSGDLIVLRDEKNNLIDQVAYGNWNDGNKDNNAPAASDPNSVARKSDGFNTFNNANDFAVTSNITKGASNIIEDENSLALKKDAASYDYSTDILISEIFPNPTGDETRQEFIELYNAGDREVDLTGWSVGSGSKKYIITGNKNNPRKNNIIKSKNFLVIYRTESRLALNNSGGEVSVYQPLKDDPYQTLKYDKAEESRSYDYVSSQNGELIYDWSETVTPDKENVIKKINNPPDVVFNVSKNIYVDEPAIFDSSDTEDKEGDALKFSWNFGDGVSSILPNPDHAYLKAGAYTVNLTVSDGENEVKKEKVIEVKDRKAAKSATTKTTGATKVVKSTVSKKSASTKSASIKSAKAKSKTASVKFQLINLEEAKDAELNSFVATKGTVAVLPGVLGSQYFYITGSPGIQIYNYKKDFPVLKVGDYIEVKGEITQSNNEKRIKTAGQMDIKVLEHKAPPAFTIASAEDVEEYPGQLIEVKGEVTGKKGSTVYLDDGTAETSVYIKKATNIKLADIKAGNNISVVGIVGKNSAGTIVLPRSQNDITENNLIQNTAEQVLGETTTSAEWDLASRDKKLELFRYLLLIAATALVILGGLFVKYFLLTRKK